MIIRRRSITASTESTPEKEYEVFMLMSYEGGDAGMESDRFDCLCKFFATDEADAERQFEMCKQKYSVLDDSMYVSEYNEYFDNFDEDDPFDYYSNEVFSDLEVFVKQMQKNYDEYDEYFGGEDNIDEELPFDSVSSAEELDVDDTDLEELEQEFSSKGTAVNSNSGKLPAIFKLITIPEGALVLDFGGGKPEAAELAQAYLDQFGATELLYDKFNQTPEHNRDVIRTCRQNGGADIAVCSNVLNVIKEPEVRLNVLENIQKLTKPGGDVYITVYEGTPKLGRGVVTQNNSSYQNNKRTQDYMEEVQQVFPDAVRKGKLIKATNSGSVTSASMITADTPSIEAITSEVEVAVMDWMTGPEGGFPEDAARQYAFVESAPVDGGYKIEVRAEISYDGLVSMSEVLDPIVQQYYPDAYFDMEAPGIMSAYLYDNEIGASTKITAGIDDAGHELDDDENADIRTLYYDPYTVQIEIPVETEVWVDDDGNWGYNDTSWSRNLDDADGDWYSEDGMFLSDPNTIVENVDSLLWTYIPEQAGTYNISFKAVLAYTTTDAEGTREYDRYGDYTDTPDLTSGDTSINMDESYIKDFQII